MRRVNQGVSLPDYGAGRSGAGTDWTGIAGLVGQAAALTGQFAGSFYSAKSQKNNLRHQARMAQINAQIAELGAKQELARGQAEYGRHTLSAGHLRSAQRVAAAANGLALNEGSAAEMLAATDVMKELDAQTIEENALRNAWGYRSQAGDYRAQAAMADVQAGTVRPFLDAHLSLLAQAPQVAEYWAKYAQQKGWTRQMPQQARRRVGSNDYGMTARIHDLSKTGKSRKQGDFEG